MSSDDMPSDQLHRLSFKESESDCLHMLDLTLLGPHDLPLALHTPAVWQPTLSVTLISNYSPIIALLKITRRSYFNSPAKFQRQYRQLNVSLLYTPYILVPFFRYSWDHSLIRFNIFGIHFLNRNNAFNKILFKNKHKSFTRTIHISMILFK